MIAACFWSGDVVGGGAVVVVVVGGVVGATVAGANVGGFGAVVAGGGMIAVVGGVDAVVTGAIVVTGARRDRWLGGRRRRHGGRHRRLGRDRDVVLVVGVAAAQREEEHQADRPQRDHDAGDDAGGEHELVALAGALRAPDRIRGTAREDQGDDRADERDDDADDGPDERRDRERLRARLRPPTSGPGSPSAAPGGLRLRTDRALHPCRRDSRGVPVPCGQRYRRITAARRHSRRALAGGALTDVVIGRLRARWLPSLPTRYCPSPATSTPTRCSDPIRSRSCSACSSTSRYRWSGRSAAPRRCATASAARSTSRRSRP